MCIRDRVDVVNGQKTGFFLDQKYNRMAMQRICKGKRVLDCFTHMGTFALNAGMYGPDSYGRQQSGILRNGGNSDAVTPRMGRRFSDCKPF